MSYIHQHPDWPNLVWNDAALAECSIPTGLRDINALVESDLLTPGSAGGRSTKYHLKPPPQT